MPTRRGQQTVDLFSSQLLGRHSFLSPTPPAWLPDASMQ
jgi:hypothetical protein